MSASSEPKNPIDQLVDLFVYAPLGFLYEREEVLDKVVTRGKSQVQLARLLAKMASQQPGGTEAMVSEAVGLAADAVSRGMIEVGVALGLVPKQSTDRCEAVVDVVVDVAEDVDVDTDPSASGDDLDAGSALPIEDYDTLTARAIIAALDDLTPAQAEAVLRYERSGRNRKTILAKVERMTA